VKLDDFVCVGNEATVAEGVRKGNIVSEVLIERNRKSGNDVPKQ
jgi:hypothetical protein